MKTLLTKKNNSLEMVVQPIEERKGKLFLAAGIVLALFLVIPSVLIEWVPVVFVLPAVFIILGAIRWGKEHNVRAKIELREEGGYLLSGNTGCKITALYVWPHVFVERSYLTSFPVTHSNMYYGIAAVIEKLNNSLQPIFQDITHGKVKNDFLGRGREVEKNIKSIAGNTKALLFHKDLVRVFNAAKYLAEELNVPVIFAQEEIKIRNLGRVPEVRLPSELHLSLPEILKSYSKKALPGDPSDYPPAKVDANTTLRYSWRKTKQIIGLILGGSLGLLFLGIGLAFLFSSSYPHTSIIFGSIALGFFAYGMFLSRHHGMHLLEVGPEQIHYTRGFPWKRMDSMRIDEVKLIFYNDFPELLIVGEDTKLHCKLQAMNPYLMLREIQRHIAESM